MAEQKILNVRVDERIMAALAERANDLDITVSELVRSFLDEGLSIKRAKPNPRNPNPEDQIVLPTTRLELYRFYEFWNANHPNIAMAIDYFAAQGRDFRIGCDAKEGGIVALDRLDRLHRLLDEKAEGIMRELALMGDAFVMINLDCQKCGGHDPLCEHKNATISEVSILDPSTIEVYFDLNGGTFVERLMMLPNRDLKNLVKSRKPESLFSQLPQTIIEAVENNKPIELDPRFVVHAKVGGSHYETYGTSMLRGLLPDLAKEDKDRQKGRPVQRVSIDPEVLHQRIASAREQLKIGLEKILNLQTSLWGLPAVTVSWPEDHNRRCLLCNDPELADEIGKILYETGLAGVEKHLAANAIPISTADVAEHFRHHDKAAWGRNSV